MIQFFFGDTKTSFEKQQFYGVKTSSELLHHTYFKEFREQSNAQALITTHQTHSSKGLVIKSLEQARLYQPYSHEGDFVVTNVPGVALGVATADCLPIILYDQIKNVIAIVHAGWQGTVAGIAAHAAYVMHQEFGAAYGDIIALFGPCARADAYEVSADFKNYLNTLPEAIVDEVFLEKHKKYYFDVPLCNQRLLEQLGVKNFNYGHNQCTITNLNFCSHRREQGKAKRQMNTVVLL